MCKTACGKTYGPSCTMLYTVVIQTMLGKHYIYTKNFHSRTLGLRRSRQQCGKPFSTATVALLWQTQPATVWSTFRNRNRHPAFADTTGQPANKPTNQPTSQPTNQPTNQPANQPTNQPTNQRISQSASHRTNQPAEKPTSH